MGKNKSAGPEKTKQAHGFFSKLPTRACAWRQTPLPLAEKPSPQILLYNQTKFDDHLINSIEKEMTTEKSVLAVIRASRPSFRNPHDKVAFAIHASFLASGFVLNATGPPAFSDNALSSSSTGICILFSLFLGELCCSVSCGLLKLRVCWWGRWGGHRSLERKRRSVRVCIH